MAILGATKFVAVDVGAARGLLPHWRQLAPFARLYMIEPDADAIPGITASIASARARNAVIISAALSEHGGTCTLYRHAVPSGSSLLPLRLPGALDYCDERHLFPLTEQQVDTQTLAEVLDAQGEHGVDMIKLDTQGTELAILRGLSRPQWAGLLSVELEVGMPGAYEGQATLADVQASLGRYDLELVDLVPKRAPLLRKGGGTYAPLFGTYGSAPSIAHRLFEVDAYYLKSIGSVLAVGDGTVMRKAIVAYSTYGFFAHAQRLADEGLTQRLLSHKEHDGIVRALRRWHRVVAIKRTPFDVAQKLVQKLGELVPRDDVRRP